MGYRCIALLAVGLLLSGTTHAQKFWSKLDSLSSFPDKYINAVDHKLEKYQEKLLAKSQKALQRFSKQEEKLQRKLARMDSSKAKELFGETQQEIARLQQKIQQPLEKITTNKHGEYIPYMDTLKTALQFLQKNNISQLNAPASLNLQQVMAKTNLMDGRLAQAEDIKRYMQLRKNLLRNALQKFGLDKQLARLNKEVYYYSQQVKEYRELLNDPDKMERKALSLLRKLPAFQQFMKEHGELAGLFNLPDDYGNANITGLQARADVEQLLQQQINLMGPGGREMASSNLQAAQSEMHKLKDNLLKRGGGDIDLPEFTPNDQKTKSLLKRLQYGANLQTVKGNNFFPRTTDIGLSIGYKINERSTAGMGLSYKMGWGENFRHIKITHQGIGLRSFIDWKWKGSFYLSGGAEWNYRSQFQSISQLKTYSAWQRSALIGLSKKYSMGKKWKGDAKLLYDVLWKQQVPVTQPVLFRTGYNF